MKRIAIIIGVIVVLGLVGFSLFRNKNSDKKELTTTVSKQTITLPLTLSGEIQAHQRLTVRFQTAGMISYIAAKEGDVVKKYQLLAQLDQRKLKNDMQQLLNLYMDTRWNFEQVKSDNQTTADTGAQQIIRERAQRLMDRAQFGLNNSVLDVEAQNLSLEFANLYSPVNGIITKAPNIAAGVNISVPTQAEFEITDPASLYFQALADQTEVTQLSVGSSALISLDADPEATLSGTIESISYTPQEGEVGTVYALTIALDPQQVTKYRLGMTGDVSFILSSKDAALVVPSSFVTSKDGKKFVKTKPNNSLVDTEVTTGIENDTEIEILTGVTEGTVVYD